MPAGHCERAAKRKAEFTWRHSWQAGQQLTDALFKSIIGFYAIRRSHSTPAGISAAQFEQNATETRCSNRYQHEPAVVLQWSRVHSFRAVSR